MILQAGFQSMDPSNLTRREVVEAQLNATVIHMIEQAVGKEKHQIEHGTTAKEAWKVLEDAYLGNGSMRRNRFDALCNEAEGFYMLDNETDEEMYGRLKVLAKPSTMLGQHMLMMLGSRGSM